MLPSTLDKTLPQPILTKIVSTHDIFIIIYSYSRRCTLITQYCITNAFLYRRIKKKIIK